MKNHALVLVKNSFITNKNLGYLFALLLMSCSTEKDDNQNILFTWHVEPTAYSSTEKTVVVNKKISLHNITTNNNDISQSNANGFALTLSLLAQESNYANIELANKSNTLYSNVYFHPELQGICQETYSGAPTFFIQSSSEGIGLFQYDIIKQSENGAWRTWSLSALVSQYEPETLIAPFVECADKQVSNWSTYIATNDVQPCRCKFPSSVFLPTENEQWQNALKKIDAEYVSSNQYDENFEQGDPVSLYLYQLPNQKEIDQLITRAKSNTDYIVTDIKVSNHRFINLVLEAEIYRNVGLAFIEKNKRWHLWYKAGDNSKGFHPIVFNGQSEDGNLQLQLCTNDCDWWGNKIDVELNLTNLTVKFIGNELSL